MTSARGGKTSAPSSANAARSLAMLYEWSTAASRGALASESHACLMISSSISIGIVAATEAVLTTAGGRRRSAGAGRGLSAKNHSTAAASTMLIVLCVAGRPGVDGA